MIHRNRNPRGIADESPVVLLGRLLGDDDLHDALKE
jgi:hypothetical protein